MFVEAGTGVAAMGEIKGETDGTGSVEAQPLTLNRAKKIPSAQQGSLYTRQQLLIAVKIPDGRNKRRRASLTGILPF
jgi:hypothetical protein